MKLKVTALVSAATFSLAALAAPLASAESILPDKSEQKAKPYKPDTCIVSGDKLGEMGKPVVFEHEGQEIKLCCKECRPEFDKDPGKHLKKLNEKK
jgi:hypothetical protein